MTNIAKITKVTKFHTQKAKKPRRASKLCNYRKNRKSNEDFSWELKTTMTNIAKITNVTKFETQKAKKPRGAPKCPQISQKSQK